MKNTLLLLLLVTLLRAEDFHDTRHTGASVDIRLLVGQKQTVELPFNFSSVWTIDIPDAISDSPKIPSRKICQVEEPYVELHSLDFYPFAQWRDFKDVIVKYEDLQRRQDILDMIVVYDTVAVCFASGLVRLLQVVQQDGKEQLQLAYEIPIEGVSADNKLTEGYFVPMQEAILFVNGDFAFRIESNKLSKLTGYRPTVNFEAAVYIYDHNIVAVAEGPDGIRLYHYELKTNELLELGVMESNFFNSSRIDISDVGTYNKDLYVLDRLNGLYQISMYKDNVTTSKLTKLPFNRSECENMVIDGKTVYVTCPEVIEVELDTFKTRSYPDELFHVKNMVVADGMVIVTGDNLIKLYIDGKLVGFYQEFRIDRIRMDSDRMYIASEGGVNYISWNMSGSKITCGLKREGNEEIEGNMSTAVSVIAECSRPYFDQNNLPFGDQYQSGLCMYHFPLRVAFWQGRQINLTPFKIVGIVLGVLLVLIGIGWFLIRRQFSMVNAAILRYSSLKPSEGAENVAYENMNEEKEEAIEMEDKSAKRKTEAKTESQDVLSKHKESSHEIGD